MTTETITHPPCSGLMSVDDIPWTSQPVERLEDRDPLTMTPTELLAAYTDLQSETRILRYTLQAAVGHVAVLTDDVRRQSRVIEFQRRQIRDQAA